MKAQKMLITHRKKPWSLFECLIKELFTVWMESSPDLNAVTQEKEGRLGSK